LPSTICARQITVGMREVEAMRKAWRARQGDKAAEFLGRHMIPVIVGPRDRYYVIDHHHLARALREEGVEKVFVTVIANLKRLERASFWFVLDNRNWMHAFDDEGRRRPYEDIPSSVKDLVDDPFRSLAAELRHAGGFAKDTTPFSEFLWADFLRRRMKRKFVEKDFGRALKEALKLARAPDADYLPGWCGPVPR
jgi:hypothetical protein